MTVCIRPHFRTKNYDRGNYVLLGPEIPEDNITEAERDTDVRKNVRQTKAAVYMSRCPITFYHAH